MLGTRHGPRVRRERDVEVGRGRQDISRLHMRGAACDPMRVPPSSPPGGVCDTRIETDPNVAVGRDKDRAKAAR